MAALTLAACFTCGVGTASAAPRERVLIIAPQNYDDIPATLARLLTGLGETVDLRTEQPTTDLDVYKSIWWADPYTAMPDQLVNDLFVYLVDGGGVYLTGERPCCEPLNASNQALLRNVLKDQDVIVGQQGDVDGPFTFNPDVTDHVATFPNELTTYLPTASGGIASLGGVSSRNVLARSSSIAVGGAWSEQDMKHARGRVAMLMDINWMDNVYRTDDEIRPIVQNLANFLGNASAPPSCPAVKVIGVAGSGENDDGQFQLGGPVEPFAESLRSSVAAMYGANSVAAPKALEYKPVSVPLAAFAAFVDGNKKLYRQSVDVGTLALGNLIYDEATEHLTCLMERRTKYVLAGYSQGAQVIGDALKDLETIHPSDVLYEKKKAFRDQISDVVFFGDPKFNAKGKSVRTRSSFLSGRTGIDGARGAKALNAFRVSSFCRFADPVCQGSRYIPGYYATGRPHERYKGFESYWAANTVAANLWRIPLKPLGTLSPTVIATPVSCGSSVACQALGATQYKITCQVPTGGTCYIALAGRGGSKIDLYLTPTSDSAVVQASDAKLSGGSRTAGYLEGKVWASAPGHNELIPSGTTRIAVGSIA